MSNTTTTGALAERERESMQRGADKDMKARVAKLPRWAQDRIRSLEQDLAHTQRQLNAAVDEANPTPFTTLWWDAVTNMHRERYLRADKVIVRHAGVVLHILPTHPDDRQRDHGVEVTYSTENGSWPRPVLRPSNGGFIVQAPAAVEAEMVQRRQLLGGAK